LTCFGEELPRLILGRCALGAGVVGGSRCVFVCLWGSGEVARMRCMCVCVCKCVSVWCALPSYF